MGVFTHLWIVMVLVFPVLIERGAIVSSGAAEIDYQLHLKSLSGLSNLRGLVAVSMATPRRPLRGFGRQFVMAVEL